MSIQPWRRAGCCGLSLPVPPATASHSRGIGGGECVTAWLRSTPVPRPQVSTALMSWLLALSEQENVLSHKTGATQASQGWQEHAPGVLQWLVCEDGAVQTQSARRRCPKGAQLLLGTRRHGAGVLSRPQVPVTAMRALCPAAAPRAGPTCRCQPAAGFPVCRLSVCLAGRLGTVNSSGHPRAVADPRRDRESPGLRMSPRCVPFKTPSCGYVNPGSLG